MSQADSGSSATTPHALSKTAIWVAAARAIGAREPDATVRNPDDAAEKLLGDPAALPLDHPVVAGLGKSYADAMQDIEVASTVRAMTERTRFIDAALERAVANGVRQVLVLGAGFDSRAYRLRQLLSQVRVFEVDRPATLAFKRQRVDLALGGPPENLVYVPVAVEREGLAAALARHGYDLALQTFVIMEGVSMYVEEEALRATFRFVASHASGSSIVFDMATPAMVHGFRNIDLQKVPLPVRPAVERMLDLFRDEPWMCGIPLETEGAYLGELGLQLGEMLTIGGPDSVRRYLTRADGTTVGAETYDRTQAMRKAAQEQVLGQMEPEQRDKALQGMREQERQNAYRIAEASVAPRPA